MNRVLTCCVLLLHLSAVAQYQFYQLNDMQQLRIAEPLYQTGKSAHTSIKPFNIWKIDSATPGTSQWYEGLAYDCEGWICRKLFNEHLLEISNEDYEITIDPVVNFRVAHDPEYTGNDLLFVNTRGFNLEGRIGRTVSFQTSYLENQARFPDYVGSYRFVVPGQGRARRFKETGVDYGIASGELSFAPNRFFTFSLGQGRNFFGEGYRSMLLSDAAFNYPFFRIETEFWRIKYVNLWAQLYDLRPAAAVTEGYAKKYLSSHYLSIHITDRWNLSLFESIVVGDTAQIRGPDIAFFNPVIFYRPVEYAVGSEQGNAMIGLNTSYLLSDGLQVYGQFLLDEFKLSAILENEGSWVNKYGWQLGGKFYNAFGVEGLFARLEYNAARPYTYSHQKVLTNYAHYSQPLAHPWGGNFQELLGQVVWQHRRLEVEARLHFGRIGLDTSGVSFGADLYKSYSERNSDLGNRIGQGAEADYSFLYLRAAYLVNPASGLKLEAGLRWRNLSSSSNSETSPLRSGESQYFFLGLRTEFFNRYYDF